MPVLALVATGEIAPAVVMYLRCVASCAALAGAAQMIDPDPCFTPGQAAGDCALACANPLNWFRFKVKPPKKPKTQCFVAGTPIHTQDGLKPIEDIQVGDLVKSKDEHSGEITWKPVTELFRNDDKEILNVILVNAEGEDETLGTTHEHPFWVENKGWVEAKDLQPGDIVTGVNGTALTVRSTVAEKELQDTYNFEVEDFHTYFVGEQGAWVHNVCNDSYTALPRQKIGKHEIEVHTDRNGPHIHVDRSSTDEYINIKNLSVDEAMKTLPKKLRNNPKIKKGIEKAKNRHENP